MPRGLAGTVKWERLYESAACLIAAVVVAGAVTLAVLALWNATQEFIR